MTEVKESIVICCERMLMELGDSIHLDGMQWPHLGNEVVGPSLDRCPWCGAALPFKVLNEGGSDA